MPYALWQDARRGTQATWQQNLNAAHADQALAERTAKHSEATTIADAEKTRADALAAARYAYLTATAPGADSNLLAAGKKYVEDTAKAEHDHAVAFAKA